MADTDADPRPGRTGKTDAAHQALLEKLNRNFVGRTPHMREIGAQIVSAGPARGTMRMPARADWLGDPGRGLMHPGALTVLADSTCGLAVGMALTEIVPYATLDLRMDYLRRAGHDKPVGCSAHCFRITPNVAFVRGDVWQDDEAEPIAVAQATFMLSTPAGAKPAAPGGVAAPSELPEIPGDGRDGPRWQAPPASAPLPTRVPIPYAEFLGMRFAREDEGLLFRLPYQEKLVGNPRLPALHGGVIAGFAETAANLHLAETLQGAKLPKGIDFSIDYLRTGRPQETFARCETVRLGSRVALVQIRCWQRDPDYPIAVARAQFLLTPSPG